MNNILVFVDDTRIINLHNITQIYAKQLPDTRWRVIFEDLTGAEVYHVDFYDKEDVLTYLAGIWRSTKC